MRPFLGNPSPLKQAFMIGLATTLAWNACFAEGEERSPESSADPASTPSASASPSPSASPGASPSPAVSHSTAPRRTEIVINVDDQKLHLVRGGMSVASYPVSTSKFGLGDKPHSYKTPVGMFSVVDKVGGNLPIGAVMKRGRFTGEVLPPNAPGRDPIVTRIIRLQGLEDQNRLAYRRGIFIHGTPEEKNIGKPVSWGCIRMRSKDVIDLYNRVDVGTKVIISTQGGNGKSEKKGSWFENLWS